MTQGEPFVDYYSVLQVDPNCSARALESAYHLLAKTYHPDHSDAADVTKLTEVIEAYKALKNPEERTRYDHQYASTTGFVFSTPDEALAEEESAISDADAHAKMLLYLYKRRREHAQDAGVGRYLVQEALGCPDNVFEFHLWYLREKGLVAITEHGTLAITIEGVDHVIAMSRTTVKEKLLISQSSDANGHAQG